MAESTPDLNANPATSPDAPRKHALSPAERTMVRRSLSLLGVLSTGSLVGVAFSLYLVGHYPLLLIALSPLGRHLVLVTPNVDPIALIAVVVVRRMLFYLACFQLGRALGPAGIPWIEARAARFGQFVRWLEGLFARAPRLVVLAFTGPTVSALAGMSGMRTGTYLPLALASLVVRVGIVVGFAEWMRDYLEIALTWIDEYWLPGTVMMVLGVAIYRWRRPAVSGLGDSLDGLPPSD